MNEKEIAKYHRQLAANHRSSAAQHDMIAQNLEQGTCNHHKLKVVTDKPMEFQTGTTFDRIGVYGGVVPSHGFEMWMICDSANGRMLCRSSSSSPTGPWGEIEEIGAAEFTTLEEMGNGIYVSYQINKGQPQGNEFEYSSNFSRDLADWSEQQGTQQPGPYPRGDVLAHSGTDVILKGDDFTIPNNYHRRWFFGSTELPGTIINNVPGLVRSETYGFSIIDCHKLGIQSVKRYWALQWIFDIHEITASGSQIGNIYPVWANSDDLVNWSKPYGMTPAIQNKDWYVGMCIPYCNPIIHEDGLLVYFFGSEYEHSQFLQGVDQNDGVGLATMSQQEFESMVR